MKRKYVQVTEKSGPKTCCIEGCNDVATRSLSIQEYEGGLGKSGLTMATGKATRLVACDRHYKALRKGVKKDKAIEKIRRGF